MSFMPHRLTNKIQTILSSSITEKNCDYLIGRAQFMSKYLRELITTIWKMIDSHMVDYQDALDHLEIIEQQMVQLNQFATDVGKTKQQMAQLQKV